MNRLKELRKSRGLNQTELAKKLGVSQATLSGWEAGAHQPDHEALIKLAGIFNVTTDYILGIDEALRKFPGAFMPEQQRPVPLVGAIKCGAGGVAMQEIEGYIMSTLDPDEHFYLRAYGDSMEPEIKAGDVVGIKIQDDVESGEIAAVLVDGEEGTLKRVIKQEGAISLVSINPKYQPRIFVGEAVASVRIMGKAVKVERTL